MTVLIKIYDDWYDFADALGDTVLGLYGENFDDLDGVMVYHTEDGCSNRLADRLMDTAPETSGTRDLNEQECELLGVKFPASVVGLHH